MVKKNKHWAELCRKNSQKRRFFLQVWNQIWWDLWKILKLRNSWLVDLGVHPFTWMVHPFLNENPHLMVSINHYIGMWSYDVMKCRGVSSGCITTTSTCTRSTFEDSVSNCGGKSGPVLGWNLRTFSGTFGSILYGCNSEDVATFWSRWCTKRNHSWKVVPSRVGNMSLESE